MSQNKPRRVPRKQASTERKVRRKKLTRESARIARDCCITAMDFLNRALLEDWPTLNTHEKHELRRSIGKAMGEASIFIMRIGAKFPELEPDSAEWRRASRAMLSAEARKLFVPKDSASHRTAKKGRRT